MSIMDELKRLARPYEDDEDELDEEYDDYPEEEEEEEEEAPVSRRSGRTSRSGSFSGGTLGDSSARDANVVSINSRAQMQVVLVKPKDLNEASKIADHLLSNRTVVLNLVNMDKKAQQMIDFLSGVNYANRGSFKKVADSTYIIAPANVQFQGSLDEMKNNGLY